jgi:hypothetical protein
MNHLTDPLTLRFVPFIKDIILTGEIQKKEQPRHTTKQIHYFIPITKDYVIDGKTYNAKVKIAVDENGNKYYTLQVDKRSPVSAVTGQALAPYESTLSIIESNVKFKSWFGDSKVVDTEGKPLVVYHGTSKKFEEFSDKEIGSNTDELGFFGRGFYFSDNANVDYYGDNVLHVYLSIQNPFVVNDENVNKLYDILGIDNPVDIGAIGNFRALIGNGNVNKKSDTERTNRITDKLKSLGYDGVIAKTAVQTEYVAFSPTQIKSVANNGEFDPNNPNIYFQRIGQRGATEDEIADLGRAQQMEADGTSNDNIKAATGWARGLDDKWWLETGGDYALKMKSFPTSGNLKVGLPLSDIIDTDNFERYSELKNIPVMFLNDPDSNVGGVYKQAENRIEINIPGMRARYELAGYAKERIDALLPVDVVRTIAHELDHYIARKEGFETGSAGTESFLNRQTARHQKQMNKTLKDLGLEQDSIKSWQDQGDDKSYLAAIDFAINENYDAAEFAKPDIRKSLSKLRIDAIILDRYGKQELEKLHPDERKKRVDEAYRNTIGEIYARRAEKAAGTSIQSLRDSPDFRAPVYQDGANGKGVIGLQSADELAAGIQEQLSYDLSAENTNQTRFFQDGPRGYFDWTNKTQQIIKIFQSGDLDTILHELGHFFSLNYINLAIETGQLDTIKPLMDYYHVSDPRALMGMERIQEDLARGVATRRPISGCELYCC